MPERLDTPRSTRRVLIRRPQIDEDASGKISESIARFLGTGKYLGARGRVLSNTTVGNGNDSDVVARITLR